MDRITPDNIQELKPNEIFVFGSNEAGIHGAGAALLAVKKFGALPRHGLGQFGQSFAIPTKDQNIKTLPLEVISGYVRYFTNWAQAYWQTTYLVTEIGCGLAGYTPDEIAPLFEGCTYLYNVSLPQCFWDVLKA